MKLIVLTSSADVHHIYPIKEYFKDDLFIDLTDFSTYKLDYLMKFNGYRFLKIEDIKLKKFLPVYVYKVFSFLIFRIRFRNILLSNKISLCIMSNDTEPLPLIILNVCKNLKIKTLVYQHGMYLRDYDYYININYNSKFKHRFLLKFYFLFREIVEELNFLPKRRTIGAGGADLYYFYSDYFKEMFINNENKNRIKIVGPTRFNFENKKLLKKNKNIVYAGCLINKWYPHLDLKDEELFSELIKVIPSDYTFLIKPHPSENINDYYNIINKLKFNNLQILNPDEDLVKYLEISEIFITNGSSLIYDAIYYENIVILIDLDKNLNFDEVDLLTKINPKEVNKIKILNLLSNKEQIFENQEKYLKIHLDFSQNNKKRFIQYIEELNL